MLTMRGRRLLISHRAWCTRTHNVEYLRPDINAFIFIKGRRFTRQALQHARNLRSLVLFSPPASARISDWGGSRQRRRRRRNSKPRASPSPVAPIRAQAAQRGARAPQRFRRRRRGARPPRCTRLPKNAAARAHPLPHRSQCAGEVACGGNEAVGGGGGEAWRQGTAAAAAAASALGSVTVLGCADAGGGGGERVLTATARPLPPTRARRVRAAPCESKYLCRTPPLPPPPPSRFLTRFPLRRKSKRRKRPPSPRVARIRGCDDYVKF